VEALYTLAKGSKDVTPRLSTVFICYCVNAPADLLLTEDARLFVTEQNPNLFVAVEQLLITTLITQDFKRLSTEQDPNLFIETEQYVAPSS
jgi:hypothetical protein